MIYNVFEITNGLIIHREFILFRQAQHVGACWLSAVVFAVCSGTAFSGTQEMWGNSRPWITTNYLMSVWYVRALTACSKEFENHSDIKLLYSIKYIFTISDSDGRYDY